jgi:chloramphenicol O-acetyltransferase type B
MKQRGPLLRAFRYSRQAVFTAMVRRMAGSCGSGLKVNGLSFVTKNTVLGDNVNINGLEVAGRGRVVIGDNFHSGPGCLFIAQIHNYDGNAIPYDSEVVLRDIVIEDNVWIGSRVIVIGGHRIGEGAIIQAGSCVTTDIPACAIAGGHPARVFKSRDRERYERLKREGKFH